MKASPESTVRRRVFGFTLSGSALMAIAFGGCGPSENKVELTPDMKKAVAETKGTDLSKYKNKGKVAKRP